MSENELKTIAEGEAATARLEKSLRSAKSIVRDYRSKLCRKAAPEPQDPNAGAFRFKS